MKLPQVELCHQLCDPVLELLLFRSSMTKILYVIGKIGHKGFIPITAVVRHTYMSGAVGAFGDLAPEIDISHRRYDLRSEMGRPPKDYLSYTRYYWGR